MDKEQKRFEQLEKLTKMLPVLIGVIGVLYLALFYFFILKPKLSRIVEGGEYDTKPVEVILNSERAYQTELKGHLERMSAISDTYKQTVANIVTLENDFPGLIVTFDEMARKHHMILKNLDVTPFDERPASGGRGVLVGTADLSGGDYGVMKAFLRDLERSRRIIDIRDIQFNPVEASISINFWAYYIEEPAEESDGVPVSG